MNGTSSEWETYFKAMADSKLELGGNFVIDCNLQQVMVKRYRWSCSKSWTGMGL